MAMYDSTHTGNEIDKAVDAILNRDRLTDFSLSDLQSAVSDNSLAKYGLKVGDEKTINDHRYIIAGLNPMKGTTATNRITVNHVGLIVATKLKTVWNVSGNTYIGSDGRGAGYVNSDLHYYLKNTLLPLVNTDLGSSHIYSIKRLLSNSVNQNGMNRTGQATGCSNGWTWESDSKICALSEIQLYGSIIWGSTGYDITDSCQQLEVFRKYCYTDIFNYDIWLRDIVSSNNVSLASARGFADQTITNYNNGYVAALIFFH